MAEYQATELVDFKELREKREHSREIAVEEEKKSGNEEKRAELKGEKDQEIEEVKKNEDNREVRAEKGKEMQKNVITCCKCQMRMSYPDGSYFVSCPGCQTVNPTAGLVELKCVYCTVVSWFPKGSSCVQCRCGAVYSVA
jgi:LSD1 subclass zinc finger protein